jgi:hypothetical protein
MTKALRGMLAAALLGGAALVLAGAAHAESYPRTYGSGESIMVEYGPMGNAMLVGGGRVMVTQTSGMNVEVVHLDAMFAQEPRPGLVPLTIGQGENTETVWVPATMVDQFRRARTTRVGR